MSKKVAWSALLIGLVALAIGSAFFPTTHILRYRLTINVDTPDGGKSGSSVVEVRYERSRALQQVFGGGFGTSFVGQAAFIDLGHGRNLVMTLTPFKSASPQATRLDYLPRKIYDLPWGSSHTDQEMRRAIARVKNEEPKAFPIEMLPLLITFRDVRDPLSLERVDPTNLEATFGPGYVLRAATVQATDLDIDQGLAVELSWLSSLPMNTGFDGSTGYSIDESKPLMISPNDLWKR